MIEINNDPDTLLPEREAASLLGYTARSLQIWRHQKKGPPFIKLYNRSIRYRRKDLMNWINENR
jgi:predicted DNA-binding transcriptional regulator AlpA